MRKKELFAYTDYPLQENKASAIVQVQLLAYDQNKYALVRHAATEEMVKTGYLFKDAELKYRLNGTVLDMLPLSASGPWPTRHQVQARNRKRRKVNKLSYCLGYQGHTWNFKNLQKALQRFDTAPAGSWLMYTKETKSRTTYSPLLCKQPSGIDVVLDSKRPRLKTRHLLEHLAQALGS